MVKTCAGRVAAAMELRLEDIRFFVRVGFAADYDDMSAADRMRAETDCGAFNEYGLSFEYTGPGEESPSEVDSPYGFYRFVLSTGGPHEEFRFSPEGRISFCLVDWFDFAEIPCTDPAAREMARYFSECEMMPKFDGIVRW